jgi:hypothetical protein
MTKYEDEIIMIMIMIIMLKIILLDFVHHLIIKLQCSGSWTWIPSSGKKRRKIKENQSPGAPG